MTHCIECNGTGVKKEFTEPQFYTEGFFTFVEDPITYNIECKCPSESTNLDIHSPEFLRQT